MKRPLLGVSACFRRDDREPVHGVVDRYIIAAAKFVDADVVIIPALADAALARSLAGQLDGLLLTGTPSNVEPSRYGSAGGDGPFDPQRDETNLTLAEMMLTAEKPVFGICRGLQELNVVYGGTLKTVDALTHHAVESEPLPALFAKQHRVNLCADGVIANALGGGTMIVNSVHFQGIDRLGDGLFVEAVADDGLIESISAKAGRARMLAVQWHPEWDAGSNSQSRWFFEELSRAIAAARA